MILITLTCLGFREPVHKVKLAPPFNAIMVALISPMDINKTHSNQKVGHRYILLCSFQKGFDVVADVPLSSSVKSVTPHRPKSAAV